MEIINETLIGKTITHFSISNQDKDVNDIFFDFSDGTGLHIELHRGEVSVFHKSNLIFTNDVEVSNDIIVS